LPNGSRSESAANERAPILHVALKRIRREHDNVPVVVHEHNTVSLAAGKKRHSKNTQVSHVTSEPTYLAVRVTRRWRHRRNTTRWASSQRGFGSPASLALLVMLSSFPSMVHLWNDSANRSSAVSCSSVRSAHTQAMAAAARTLRGVSVSSTTVPRSFSARCISESG